MNEQDAWIWVETHRCTVVNGYPERMHLWYRGRDLVSEHHDEGMRIIVLVDMAQQIDAALAINAE